MESGKSDGKASAVWLGLAVVAVLCVGGAGGVAVVVCCWYCWMLC